MRRKRVILLVTLAAIVAGGVVARHFWLKEQIVRGKPASYWIEQLGDTTKPLGQMCSEWRLLGTNSVPLLMKAMQQGTGLHQRAYQAIWSRSPSAIKSKLPRPDDAHVIRRNAMYVLTSLGVESRPAMPALIRIMRADQDRTLRMTALDTLAKIKTAPGATPQHDPGFVAAFAAALQDPDMMVRLNAAGWLGHIGDEPGVAVPALIIGLQDSDGFVRYRAAQSLGAFGQASKPAVPALVKAMGDKEVNVRLMAIDSLRKIDPQALDDALKREAPAKEGS